MKIYKFKDLTNPEERPHFLQIIENNEIWCAAPDSFDDENEFRFELDYEPSNDTPALLAAVIEKLGTSKLDPHQVAKHSLKNNKLDEITNPIVAELITQMRGSIGVTCFTTVSNGDQLWSEYGGHGYGARIEFELSDQSVGKIFHLVDYVHKKIFHVDVILKSQLTNCQDLFRKILCTKTKKWENQNEIRFIGNRIRVGFILDTPITNVTFGDKVPSEMQIRYSQICQKREIDVS